MYLTQVLLIKSEIGALNMKYEKLTYRCIFDIQQLNDNFRLCTLKGL